VIKPTHIVNNIELIEFFLKYPTLIWLQVSEEFVVDKLQVEVIC